MSGGEIILVTLACIGGCAAAALAWLEWQVWR